MPKVINFCQLPQTSKTWSPIRDGRGAWDSSWGLRLPGTVRMSERTGKSQDAKIQQDRFSWIGIYSTVVDDYQMIR